MDGIAFLEKPPKGAAQPVYVVHGDEDFVKREVLRALREFLLPDAASEFCYSSYPGESADYATVVDELHTLPFLGGRRVVAVENADSFVTRHRGSLESYLAAPTAKGTLILEVKTWTSTTRLAKLLDAKGAIQCKSPAAYKVPEWCVAWAKSRHGQAMSLPAAQSLVDLVGAELGLLDQEISKLAAYVGKGASIAAPDVDRLVGASREESIWKLFDAIGAGNVAESIAILDRVLAQGDAALKVLGAISSHMRKLAQAVRLSQIGVPLSAALAQAGVPPFAIRGSEQQIRHLGPGRVGQLYDWLLEIDGGLKGASQLNERTQLERLVVRMAQRA